MENKMTDEYYTRDIIKHPENRVTVKFEVLEFRAV